MMRGYDAPRGGYGPALRDPRGYYNNRHYQTQGPSPWIPATILGVIVLITVTSYMRTPDAAMVYYTAGVRPSSRFPGAALWIPVLCVIALQFFGGPWYHGYGQAYYGQRHGMMRAPGMFGYPSGAFGGVIDHRAPWGASSRLPWSSSSSSLWNPYNRYYNIHQQRGVVSTFMDYGGHWLLIFLGIAVFTLVSGSSVPSTPVSLAPHWRRWLF